ncbi:MAG: hypothetical protein HYV36_01800 [Lentisphaerae bacterium]|nr:hypothetical protein [Lentisphaerota bacterium]
MQSTSAPLDHASLIIHSRADPIPPPFRLRADPIPPAIPPDPIPPRFLDALKVMEQNKKLDANNDKIDGFINQIKELQQLNARIMQSQN